MLSFTLGHTADKLIVTLTELVTINDPYFLFIFENIATRQTVAIIYFSGADESDYPDRYNEFTINTQAVFGAYLNGQWLYTAYQQISSTNTNPDATQGILEYGKMILNPVAGFEYVEYNLPLTYKAYNG